MSAPLVPQPTAACKAPDGTPDHTYFYLTNGAVSLAFVWRKRRWFSTYIEGRSYTPSELARRGWKIDQAATDAARKPLLPEPTA